MKRFAYWIIIIIFLMCAAAAFGAVFVHNEGVIKADEEEQLAEQAIRREQAISGMTAVAVECISAMSGPAAEAEKDSGYPAQTIEGASRGISILMYHTVYDPLDPPQPRIDNNYISTVNLEEQLSYLVQEGYSFPTWKEVRRYIDGEIDLPEKSVVLTFDDGTDGFRKHGVPLLNKYRIPATAFIIVSKNGKKWAANKDDYPYLDLESHSYDMHRGGGRIGHGGRMTAMTFAQIYTDLKESQAILGNSNAFAYPFGDVDSYGKCRDAAEQAGFLVAVTTRYGKARPGMDPMLLPRMRINGRNTLMAFRTLL